MANGKMLLLLGMSEAFAARGGYTAFVKVVRQDDEFVYARARGAGGG
jgi:hypothetical protein